MHLALKLLICLACSCRLRSTLASWQDELRSWPFGAQRCLEESALLSSTPAPGRYLRSSSAATSSWWSGPSLGCLVRADGQVWAGTSAPTSPATAPPAARARSLRPPSCGRSHSSIPQAPGDRLGVLSGSRALCAGSGRDFPRFVEDPAPVCDARRRVFARCACRLPRIASHATSLLLSPVPPALQSRPRAPHLHPLDIPSHFPACLQEFFSLALPSLASLAGSGRRRRTGTGRLANRRARHPVGAFPRLWALCTRSLLGACTCTLFCSVACTWCRVGRVPRVVGPVKGVCRLPVRASRCRCKLSLHICELVHDITSIYYIYEMKLSMVRRIFSVTRFPSPVSLLHARTAPGPARPASA